MNDYWNDLIYCDSCQDDHTRMTWHSMGMLCGRCGQHTGNNNQGHYWGLCKRLLAEGIEWNDAIIELHFCCPNNCELAT